MQDANTSALVTQLGSLVTNLLNSSSIEKLAELWKLWRQKASGLNEEGLYEVLDYEATLELLDRSGQRARFRKREKVRYLQNQTIAYQDQAWADGEILLDYRCTPGVPVDQYRLGQRTCVLISLREVKGRGDVDEFNMEWGIRGGFLRSSEQWETEVSHRTRNVKVRLVFPRNRRPRRIAVVEGTSQRLQVLPEDALVKLPDGRWMVSWETDRPRIYERYILKWDW